MVKLLKLLYEEFYLRLMEWRDPRMDNFFLMGGFWKPFTIMGLYLYFVINLGPKLMKKRKAFDLKYVLMFYNLFQVVTCSIVGFMALRRFFFHYGHWHCVHPDYYSEDGFYEAKLSYCFYLLKILDLLDTVFFVLRKKQNQITFLHVYHHFMMVLAGYCHTAYLPGGQIGVVGVVNPIVHSIMYSYYFYSSIKENSKSSSLWWKKYITLIQMIQFVFIIVFVSLPFFDSNCKYPRILLAIVWLQNVFLLSLFSDFYINAYIKKKKTNKNGKIN